MSGQRGRPRTDRVEVFERVTVEFLRDPRLSPDEIRLSVGARRRDVWRIVACLRAVLERGTEHCD
jgi:hypothetical protein